MNVVVLGTTASIPTKRELTSCVAVKHGGNYLFDACEAVQVQCAKYGVGTMRIEAVFITHMHADHFLGLFGLVQTMGLQGRSKPLVLVTPKGGAKTLGAVFALPSLRPKFPLEFREAGAKASKVYENDLFAVTAFPVKHSTDAVGYALECHSYRRFDERKARSLGVSGRLFGELERSKSVNINGKTIKYKDVTFEQPGRKIVFTGDTAPTPAIARMAKGADLLIHDSTFGSDDEALAKEKLHSTAAQAAKAAAKAKCKKLLLTHFSNRYEAGRGKLEEEARAVFPESACAAEGMELSI